MNFKDELLQKMVAESKERDWEYICSLFPGRDESTCIQRWNKLLPKSALAQEVVKGPWTPEEDAKVIKLVTSCGPRKWSVIAGHLPGRIGKQCRERWHNHLNPEINKAPWTAEEDRIIMEVSD